MTQQEFRINFSRAVAEDDFQLWEDNGAPLSGESEIELSNEGLDNLTNIAEAQAEPLFDEIRDLKGQLQRSGVAMSELWAKLHNAEKQAKDANQARVELSSALTDVLAAWKRDSAGIPEYTPEWRVAEEALKVGGFIKTASVLYDVLKLATALRVYANKSMWVKYERDGEETASLFVANEAGLEDGALYDGWLVAEAALKEGEPE